MKQYISQKYNAIFPRLSNAFRAILRYPFLVACATCFLYIVLFQWNFLITGDSWAESFAEYVDEALRFGWSEVFAQNWAGYFTVVPSLISKTVVTFVSLGYVDYYLRVITIVFAVLSASLISLKFFRSIIEQDYLRILLSLLLIVSLVDIASFSFINIWYLGLVPIIAYTLSPARTDRKLDAFMGLYGSLLVLTKPFVILPALLIYRMVRTRQFFGPSVILVASIVQSVQILFFDTRNAVEQASHSIVDLMGGTIVGIGTAPIKLLHIESVAMWGFCAAIVFSVCLLALLWRLKGPLLAVPLSLVYLFALITYVLAPDGVAYFGLDQYNKTLAFIYKSQREILINAFLLLAVFAVLSEVLKKIVNRAVIIGKKKIYTILTLLVVLFFVGMYRPIDVTSGAVTGGVGAFRSELSRNQPVCIPLAPSTLYTENSNWSFAYRGVCRTMTHDLNLFQPDLQNFSMQVQDKIITYETRYFGLQSSRLTAIAIPVVNTTPKPCLLSLDSDSRTYWTRVDTGTYAQLAIFNMSGISLSDSYRLRIGSSCGTAVLGTAFIDTSTLASYPYFLDSTEK